MLTFQKAISTSAAAAENAELKPWITRPAETAIRQNLARDTAGHGCLLARD